MAKIEVNNVYKIFGTDPIDILPRVKEGATKEEVLEETGHTVGTWNGKTYRISIDGDCHNFNYRADYFKDADFAAAWKAEGHNGAWGVPKTFHRQQSSLVRKSLRR